MDQRRMTGWPTRVVLMCGFLWCSGGWLPVVSAGKGLQPGVAEGGSSSNPGFKVRVTQAALDYLESLAGNAMSSQFQRVRINDVTGPIQGGDIRLSNIVITKYRHGDKHAIQLQPPDQVIWTMSGADISLHGQFDARVKQLLTKTVTHGDFDTDAEQVDFNLALSFHKTADGGVSVKTRGCNANIRNLNVQPHISGPSPGLLGLYKLSLANQMRPLLQSEICRQATQFIDEDLNRQLATQPRKLRLDTVAKKMPTNGSGQRRLKDQAAGAGKTSSLGEIIRELSKNLLLDYSIIKDPVVTSRYIETSNRGEVSYNGGERTPFYPTDLKEQLPAPSDRMAYIVASDYVVNSLFWQAYRHGGLIFHVNGREYPEHKAILQTTCEGVFDICIGNVVPELGEAYPKSDVEIVFQLIKSPAVFFRKTGMVDVQAPAYVILYARQGNRLERVMTSNLDVRGSMKIWIEKDRIKGNATVDTFKLKLDENNLKDFNQEKLDSFADMARAMFQDLANNEFNKGLPLPVVDGVRLVNPKLTVYERTLRAECDLNVDQNLLISLAQSALKNSTTSVSIAD